MNDKKNRYLSIDVIRGLAIMIMIQLHFFYDCIFVGLVACDLRRCSTWIILRIITVSLFTVVMGICYSLSTISGLRKKLLSKRTLVLGASAVFITISTYIFCKKGVILFGAIHFFFLMTFVCAIFAKLKRANLLLGILFIIIGVLYKNKFFNGALFWLGFVTKKPHALDYLPVFPWFGVILIGMYIGTTFFENRTSDFLPSKMKDNKAIKILGFFGRNSLLIYIIHQPILYTTALLLSYLLK